MLQPVPTTTPRLTGGRKPRRPVAVSEDVHELVRLVQQRTPQDVAYWLHRYVSQKVDEELETLATFFLSNDFGDIASSSEVKALLSRGRYDGAIELALSRMRRRTSKVLRDHQRSEDDAFLDSCVAD